MFEIAIHHRSDHLKVVAAGPADLGEMQAVLDVAACISMAKRYRRALIDLRATQPHLTFTEHLALGAHGAGKLGGLEQVATVITPEYRSGVSEKAARHQGLRLRTFTDLCEAEAWLRIGPTSSGASRPRPTDGC